VAEADRSATICLTLVSKARLNPSQLVTCAALAACAAAFSLVSASAVFTPKARAIPPISSANAAAGKLAHAPGLWRRDTGEDAGRLHAFMAASTRSLLPRPRLWGAHLTGLGI
jgi:hypothetical protein